MDIPTLKTLIQGDQSASQLFAAGNDTGCAAQCVQIAPKISQSTLVTYRILAAQSGIGIAGTRRLVISMGVASSVDPLVDVMTSYLVDNSPTGGIDISDAGVQTMLNAFAAANTTDGLIPSDVTNIIALCMVSQNITSDDIAAVRRAG